MLIWNQYMPQGKKEYRILGWTLYVPFPQNFSIWSSKCLSGHVFQYLYPLSPWDCWKLSLPSTFVYSSLITLSYCTVWLTSRQLTWGRKWNTRLSSPQSLLSISIHWAPQILTAFVVKQLFLLFLDKYVGLLWLNHVFQKRKSFISHNLSSTFLDVVPTIWNTFHKLFTKLRVSRLSKSIKVLSLCNLYEPLCIDIYFTALYITYCFIYDSFMYFCTTHFLYIQDVIYVCIYMYICIICIYVILHLWKYLLSHI